MTPNSPPAAHEAKPMVDAIAVIEPDPENRAKG
jgi:hypothetical protein